ncbi:MAG: hypothetical protein ABIJ56_16370 [Pseudomonadota bacterium]
MSLALPEIRRKGWEALIKALGYAGATRFILVYEKGSGDYTKDRKKLFRKSTLESIARELKK